MSEQNSTSELVLILTNESDLDRANALTKSLLELKLVACVNMFNVQSHYTWKDKLVKDEEVQLIIKTSKENLEELLNVIQKLHSYETPELIFWSASVSEKYGNWLESVLSPV